MARAGKWPTARVGEIAQRAIALATELQAELDPRLPAGLIDGLRADAEVFGVKRSAATRGKDALVSATRTQNQAAASAHALVSSVRAAVARTGGNKAAQKAFGVGGKLRATSVPQVLAGLDSIIVGAADHPDVARGAGVLSTDIDKARALRAALAKADADQEATKEVRKSGTSERVSAQGRIESAVDAIISAGSIAFHDRPDVAARFAAIIPGTTKKAKPTKATPAAT